MTSLTGVLTRRFEATRQSRRPIGRMLRFFGIDPLWLYQFLRPVEWTARLLGINPREGFRNLRAMPRFLRDLRTYARAAAGSRFPVRWRDLDPILQNFYGTEAGTAGGHYFHMDLDVARRIHARRPESHVDIGSRIDGFITHLLVFMPVTLIDIRPLTSNVPGLTFVQADATDLSRFPDDSIDSLSALSAIDCFGLGRYGDPVDPDAWHRAARALARVLKPGGRLYLGIWIGRERAQFNAHRVFAPETVTELLSDLELLSFSAVDDHGEYRADARLQDFRDADYACGIYEFTKSPRA